MVISHINKQGKIQTNDDHQKGVAEMASRFASGFGMTEWGRVLGLLHDKGKERHAFQQYIRNPKTYTGKEHSHAYVGGLVARHLFPLQSLLLTNPIMGHHRGLYDDSEMRYVMKSSVIPKEICLDPIESKMEVPADVLPRDVHHIERMLYSCLVDADCLDTERYMSPRQYQLRGSDTTIKGLLVKLEAYLDSLRKDAPDTEVNRVRNYVQDRCRQTSDGEKGIYSLTVPTGGGKTLASVLWALRHAIRNNQERVIIVIPYTSIIVQTASILRNIFGDGCVLEHHSDNDIHSVKSSIRRSQRIATENWDYPIIVTTNVQLFESMYAHKPSTCRKLHNIVNSVVVMDEAQTLPPAYLQSILDAIDTYRRLFGVSLLFTTASQPALTGTIYGSNKLHPLHGLDAVTEIIQPSVLLHSRLRRVTFEVDKEPTDYDKLAYRIKQHPRVLCIVNTRNDAKEIYSRLPQNKGTVFHLSRLMTPAHISITLDKIRHALADESRTIRVVATQLIEAGVDMDFPVVYRQEAGLDSILQAAGRCNREGKLNRGKVVVFRFDKPLPPGFISQGCAALRNLYAGIDWLDPVTMREYFRQFYSRVSEFDAPHVKDLLYYPDDMQFETAAARYHLINDDTVPVIISNKHTLPLFATLKEEGINYTTMKKLARYSVNVRPSDIKRMKAAGILEEPLDGIYVATAGYRKNIGLTIEKEWINETQLK